MTEWPHHGLEDDLRPRMAELMAARRSFALVTVWAADGGPRGVGAQMVVTEDDSRGFVSGGCIEADVALHARQTLADGQARRLIYGRGSPWIDTRLPCGGRLDLLVEPIAPDDEAIGALIAARQRRETVRYQSEGQARRCVSPQAAAGDWLLDAEFAPPQRLIVIGSDPIALATAALGARLGWVSTLVWPNGPQAGPGLGVEHRCDAPEAALAALAPDALTAVAIATHDIDDDDRAIQAALTTQAGYIGVLGARRRIPGRLTKLRAAGFAEPALARLRMPIGLTLGAATPWEIAVSVTGEIIAARRAR